MEDAELPGQTGELDPDQRLNLADRTLALGQDLKATDASGVGEGLEQGRLRFRKGDARARRGGGLRSDPVAFDTRNLIPWS
jgi:hypothetical protein